MNKNTFISELSRKLRGLPKAEYDDAMNYYIEYLMDAGVDDTADVTPIVGNVNDVAARILEECTDKQIEKVKTEGGVKNNTKAVWFILLGLFAAPIAFPLAFVAAIVVFTIFISVVAVIVSLIAASVGLVIVGLAAVPAIFWAETGSQAMVLVGIACIAIAIGVLMCIIFYKLGELIVRGLIKLFRYIAKKRSEKRTAGAANANTMNSADTVNMK